MTGLVLNIFSLSLSMSAVIVVLLLLSRAFGKYFRAKCRYIVWTIVIISLCLPIGALLHVSLISFDVPVQGTREVASASENGSKADVSGKDASAAGNNKDSKNNSITGKDTGAVINASSAGNSEKNTKTDADADKAASAGAGMRQLDLGGFVNSLRFDTILKITLGIWLIGAIISAGVKLTVHFAGVSSFNRRKKLCDEKTYRLYNELCARMGIESKPKLYQCDSVGSPLLYGIFDPSILLPDYSLTECQTISVLSHELTHYRRRDLIVKLICLICESIH